MMTGCIVGRDDGEVRDRLAAWREITRGTSEPPICGTVDQVSARLREYEAAGVERAMLQHLVHEDVEMVALLGEVAAQVAARGPGWPASRAHARVPAVSSHRALLTKEWTPLEPDVVDHKLYVRGIGLVDERTIRGGDERNALARRSH
jgi:hypothetical protein